MFCQDLVKYCSCAVFHDKLNAKFKWKEDEKYEWCHRTLESSNWCTTSSITWVWVCFMTISHSEFEGNTPVVKWTGLAAAQCGCTCYSAGTLFALFSKTLRHTTGWAKTGIKNNVRKLAVLKAKVISVIIRNLKFWRQMPIREVSTNFEGIIPAFHLLGV